MNPGAAPILGGTLKVAMLTTIPGTCDGKFLIEGTVVDINEKTATFLIEEMQAEPYPKPEAKAEPVPEPEPEVEPDIRTADVVPPQNAAKRAYNRKTVK